jgi:hypothetical protein
VGSNPTAVFEVVMKKFRVLEDDGEEGYFAKEVGPEDSYYKDYINALAYGSVRLVEFPEPSPELLGEEGYQMYVAERERLEAVRKQKSEAGKKGAAARLAKRNKP